MERSQFASLWLMQNHLDEFVARVKQHGQVIVTSGKLQRYVGVAFAVTYLEDALEYAERNYEAGLCPPTLRIVGNVSLKSFCEDVVKSIEEQADQPNTLMVLSLDDVNEGSVALQMFVPEVEGIMMGLNTELMESIGRQYNLKTALTVEEAAKMLGITLPSDDEEQVD